METDRQQLSPQAREKAISDMLRSFGVDVDTTHVEAGRADTPITVAERLAQCRPAVFGVGQLAMLQELGITGIMSSNE